MDPIASTPIGVVRSPYTALEGMPLQPLFDTRENARAGWFEQAGPRVHQVRSDRRYER